ncbi:alanyl-tRNA editing protein [Halosolutus gelatinilyticus]|uniref:alanyl-tRNA editing protein n=1 Tax=Halosolutus gelatinilyticus TaxID=2931975 RepID=UPI001FF3343B|nr:alanine--tRNA ligase-related protein [Halosolutus gelatinilyticus]
MSGQRAAAEPYTTRFETEVTSIDGRQVWLETSYFYGESGGQPADRGTIGDVAVEGVRYADGEQVHVLAAEPSFATGQRVLCSIDWSFRMYCMRAHTASHVLYGAGRRLLDDLGYGGFDISDEKVRVDLETSTPIDDETLIELNELVNRAVWESRPVSWEDVPVAEARERDGIAFNEATEEGAFRKGRVRIVTIGSGDDNGNGGRPNGAVNGSAGEPWDVAACGGTHVRNTREIGPVTVLDRSNPGEGVTRVELAVGPRAIGRRTVEKRTAYGAKRALGVAVEDVPDELDRLADERDGLAREVRTLRRELVETRLAGETPFDRGGCEWIATTVEDVDSNEASEVAREVVGEVADVVVLVGAGDSPYAVVATNGSVSAAAVVTDVTDQFGGGGGGSERVAQAGGFDAAPDEVLSAVNP